MTSERTWRVGIDVGGTFTDVVAANGSDGELRSAKVRTRKADPLTSIARALEALRLSWSSVEELIHGTTVVTNAIVEGQLEPVALVTTSGFSDVLDIGRQNRRYLYRLDRPPKPPPLVPEQLRFEVAERLGPSGAVLEPLDTRTLAWLADQIRAAGATSVAVTLVHAYANPAHELLVEKHLAGVARYTSLSHRVNPEEREFERTSATVLNAGIMPLVARYLDAIEAALPSHVRLMLFHSAGGMVSTDIARERPVVLALSGPSAGVTAASRIATELGLPMALTLDMGGTTTDVSLIRNGMPEVGRDAQLAGHRLRQPMVAVESIGAGGGSIAYFESGSLRVGPRSAGAEPGPACFGRGGDLPTVTDAMLLLGYLDPGVPLGGEIVLSPALAHAAVERLAGQVGLGVVETALGIVRIANSSMVRALRNITIQRGIDGRKCALLSYGGAGPMHAVQLARDFGIETVIVPRFSSAFSALGCVAADPSFTQHRTLRMVSDAWDARRFSAIRQALLEDVLDGLRAGRSGDVAPVVDEDVFVKYVGQSYSVEVPYVAPADPRVVGADFVKRHAELYGFATDEAWQVEAIRIRARIPRALATAGRGAWAGGGEVEAAPSTRCWFDASGPVTTPRYRREELAPGASLRGPAIVFDAWSTVVLPPGSAMTVDRSGSLVIQVRSAA